MDPFLSIVKLNNTMNECKTYKYPYPYVQQKHKTNPIFNAYPNENLTDHYYSKQFLDDTCMYLQIHLIIKQMMR